MNYRGGYSFHTSFTWQEMLGRLKRVGQWDEWWNPEGGDALISVAASNPWEGHFEKITLLWNPATERWRLAVHFESRVADLEERWERFVSLVCETLVIVDAASVEKLDDYGLPDDRPAG